mgnify:CR=1 FL=1
MKNPVLIERILSGGFKLLMKVKKCDEKDSLLVIQRAYGPEDKVLLTVENMSYSRLKNTVSIVAKGFRWVSEEPKDGEVIFDSIGYRNDGKAVFLNHKDYSVCFMADEYLFVDDRPLDWQQQELCGYARIQKEDGTREDYVNHIPGLKCGDHVLVEDGEKSKEGVVVHTFFMKEYEMPEKKYANVIQKIAAYRLS